MRRKEKKGEKKRENWREGREKNLLTQVFPSTLLRPKEKRRKEKKTKASRIGKNGREGKKSGREMNMCERETETEK